MLTRLIVALRYELLENDDLLDEPKPPRDTDDELLELPELPELDPHELPEEDPQPDERKPELDRYDPLDVRGTGIIRAVPL